MERPVQRQRFPMGGLVCRRCGRCFPWSTSHPYTTILCAVAIRNPHSGLTEFYISRTHFFGLAAAVVNVNRLPELMTAVCRRIGKAPSWHFFDDQGTLDFEIGTLPKDRIVVGMSASLFVGFVYDKVGTPLKPSKHLPPTNVQTHLG